jgi:uncharacterized membrane-anchored protein YhcB (DUF1043 family)
MSNKPAIRKYLTDTAKSLDDLARTLRQYIKEVDDPKAEALFETSAEVLKGLKHAYDDFLQSNEKAWK